MSVLYITSKQILSVLWPNFNQKYRNLSHRKKIELSKDKVLLRVGNKYD